jgi:hypothetical protein
MKYLASGERTPVTRCYADSEGRRYFGEVLQHDKALKREKIVFTDPEHPRLKVQQQWSQQWGHGGFVYVQH